jgi:hypothetical protein
MNYKLWITIDNQKLQQIPHNSLSELGFGDKSDAIAELKFVMNSRDLNIVKLILEKTNIEILLEIGDVAIPFIILKKIDNGNGTYNINLAASYNSKKDVSNPLENQTYSGSLSSLLSQLAPEWDFVNVNKVDQNIAISVGSDNPLATTYKAIHSQKLELRFKEYKNSKWLVEYGDFSKLAPIVQLNSTNYAAGFGDKNLITSLVVESSSQYLSEINPIGKYDTGSSPEFNLNNYIVEDSDYSIVMGKIVDNSLANQPKKSITKKFTIPSNLANNLLESQKYLYSQARQFLYEHNAKLTDYKLTVVIDKFLQPLDVVKIFYNKTIRNHSGIKITRIDDTKLISGIEYNLSDRTVALTLTSTGKFNPPKNQKLILDLNKQIKGITQNS